MRYFAPASTKLVRDAMQAGVLDCILTPGARNRAPERVTWAADNGAFSAAWQGDDQAWWEWVKSRPNRDLCAFIVAPDVIGDAVETLARSLPWLSRIRELGMPAAFVAQDGLEKLAVQWDTFDVLFIGGSTAWKLSPHARFLTLEALDHGKTVHMGRVNSLKRWKIAHAWGCASVDGSFLTYGPDVLMPQLLGWLRHEDQLPLWEDS